jgi:Rieske Fe-S protein
MTAATSTVGAVLMGIPLIGYLVGALRKQPVEWINLGSVAKFPVSETRLAKFENPLGQPWDGMAAHMGVYVRNLGRDEKERDQFLVFAMNCAHLGCPVTWFPQSGLFMCPCHGGVYYENGERASGPPERGLFHCVWRVRDGQLEVQAPHLPTLQDTLDESMRA